MIAAVVLVISAAAAGAGLLLEAPIYFRIILIAAAAGGLVAWDLISVTGRLRHAAIDDDTSTIMYLHLIWLGFTVGSGLALTAAAMLIPLHFSFAWTVVLALAAILGMAQLVSRLHQS